MVWEDFDKMESGFCCAAPLFCKVGLKIQGWAGIWWIHTHVGYLFRLWLALDGRFLEHPIFRKRPAIEMIEMIEMIWVPLAGIVLRGGEWGRPEGRRDSDICDLGVCDPGVGYGICLWFRKIRTEHNPCFVVPPLFLELPF